MKRALICILVFLPLLGFAKKPKGYALDFMKGEKSLNITFDISKAGIMGADNEEESMLVPIWKQDSSALVKHFYNGVRDELGNYYFLFGNRPDANYKAIIHIQQVAQDGSVYSLVDFMPNSGGEILCSFELVGTGGRFGSFLNLFCDGLEESGEAFGKILKKYIKKK